MADIPVGFRPINYDSGKVHTMLTVSSTTIAKGDALDFSGGYVQRATSSSTDVYFVALEAKTTAASAHENIQCVLTSGVRFLATCNSTPSQANVGVEADLTDHNTVNEASSTNDTFLITKVIDTTNKIIEGYFINGT